MNPLYFLGVLLAVVLSYVVVDAATENERLALIVVIVVLILGVGAAFRGRGAPRA